MRCSQCGAQIDDDSKFCSRCGSPISTKEEKVPEPMGHAKKTNDIEKLENTELVDEKENESTPATLSQEEKKANPPTEKDDGGIVKPMKILLGMVGGFALFCYLMTTFLGSSSNRKPKQQPTQQQVTQQQTQQTQQKQQQKQQQSTQQQAQQQQRKQEQQDLQFSNFHVDYLPNFDGQNNLYVRVSCVVQNISDKEIRLTTTNCFLRKPGANTFESDFSTSGFTKDLNANNTGIKRVGAELQNLMELWPGDKAGALLIFKTNIQRSQATGWEVHIKYYPKGSGEYKRLKVYTIP